MAKNTQSNVSYLADRYVRSKEELQKTLIAEDDLTCESGLDNVVKAEKTLEQSFADLIAARTTTIDDLLIKARTFIDETISEAELANYHKQSLLSLLDDISRLRKKP